MEYDDNQGADDSSRMLMISSMRKVKNANQGDFEAEGVSYNMR